MDLLVFVDPKRPTGTGESISGSAAFFINAAISEEWHVVEQHPAFTQLCPEHQEIVRKKFPVCVERYKAIYFTSVK
jgi:hypothetical protein